MAKIRQGVRCTPMPALKSNNGMANDNPSKAELFCKTFFLSPSNLPDLSTIPFLQKIECLNIISEEITNALKTTSNKSAPELSSIGYQLLKAAWKSQAPLILSLSTIASILDTTQRFSTQPLSA